MKIFKRLINWKYSYLYLLSITGGLLFWFFGPETLSCQRVDSTIIDCQIFRTTAFGLVKQENFSLTNLKNVRVDERIEETINADQTGTTITKRPVYGVVLEFDKAKKMAFQGYGYQRQPKQLLVATILKFLSEPEQDNLTIEENRSWQSSIFPLSLIIFPIAFILKTEFFSTSK